MTLKLTILQNSSSTEEITACSFYTWHGTTYTSSGTYFDTILNDAGCDSLLTLNLTINHVSDLLTTTTGNTITANIPAASYQWIDCSNIEIIQGENVSALHLL